MIWLWIILALVLSYLPLINKKIDLANYMWILIPVDAYGISVAGATIKPYMIFAVFLPIALYAKNKGTQFDLSASKGQLLAGIISTLIIIVNLFNSTNPASVKAAFMTLVVYICAQFYVSCTDCSKSDQLNDVFIASCFGCGIVYIATYFLMQSGLFTDSIVANVRADNGLYLQMNNMVNGNFSQSFRLRGFSFDPNTMFVQFIFGITACVSKIAKKFNLYHLVTLLISVFCILLSGSRMGLLCCITAIVITAIVAISELESIRKKLLSIIATLTICVGALIFSMSRFGQSMLSSLFSAYSNRSSLTDEYGRFSIWNECVKIYWEKNPLFGVGYNNMSTYTMTERMTHNTYLQFICECGLLVGGLAVIYFLSIAFIGWSKLRFQHKISKNNGAFLPMVIGYTMTLVSLFSVDNLTCSYLWFGALTLIKIAYYVPQDTEHTLTA